MDHARCWHFACIITFNPHNKPERIGTMIMTIVRENKGSEENEGLSHLHKVHS